MIVKCAVCYSLIFEIHKAIHEVDPLKTVEVGSFRIDIDGKQRRSTKKYAGSETHMTELLESICEVFSDYVQARHKETGRFEAIKLVENGKMNPNFNDYELVQDPELNKGVQYYCQSIVEDHEDDIITFFQSYLMLDAEKSKVRFCEEDTGICATVKDEL